MSEPIDEMQKHLAEAEAEITRLKGEITELTKHVQLGAEHKKDPIWAMLKAEMANQGYRKGYDQAMEKSHQFLDRMYKRSAELEQLLGECIRLKYYDEAKASPSTQGAAMLASLVSSPMSSSVARAPVPAPKLGTGHGEREYSYVNHTEFLRMQTQPNEVIRIRYDSLDNLFAMGIIRRPRPATPTANPFPSSPEQQYVPDPRG